MAGKRTVGIPFSRARRVATVTFLALAFVTTPTVASFSGAAMAVTDPCAVNPGQGNYWASADVDAVQAGTVHDGELANGYSLMGAAEDMGAYAYYNGDGTHHYYGQDSITGKPIDVALIDTGVAPVQGLQNGNVIHGPDLSFESQTTKFAHIDTNGHGTFMASLIAGRDYDNPLDPAIWAEFNGIAPLSRVVSVKVADSQGGVDVTQVIAAIDWVTAHAHDNGLNIRVLNLSLGFGVIDNWSRDALSYAVDQAWRQAKIVVVAAAGNSGPGMNKSYGGVTNPGYNNEIIAVGAYDTGGTPRYDASATKLADANFKDDTVPPYTSGANRYNPRSPDFVAPGQHVTGLHVVNSNADIEMHNDCTVAHNYGNSWTTPVFGPNDRFGRGSGTSEAAALTSGAVALMLSKNPTLSPDQVKRMLTNTAIPFGAGSNLSGNGEINLPAVYAMTPPVYSQSKSAVSKGGAMDGARGGWIDAYFGTVYHDYVQAFTELVPGACTNYWSNFSTSYDYINPDPAYVAALSQAFASYCQTTALQDKVDAYGNPVYTDIFGNGIDLPKLQSDESAVYGLPPTSCPSNKYSCFQTSAWKTPVGKNYQVWSGDPALTLGTGFISDPNTVNGVPILGKVWASGTQSGPYFKAWPTRNWALKPFLTDAMDTTHVWQSVTQRWSLTSTAWLRFSLTGQDWSSHSLRDNGWG